MGAAAWRLLAHPPGSAAWNMSVDEALLLAADGGAPVLRLYSWRQATASLGYRQEAPSWLHRCSSLNVEVVRRISGGGTVLHAGDLTYAVVAPTGTDDVPDDVHGSYEWVRAVLIDGLRVAGLDAVASRPVQDANRAPICFAAATGTEIDVGEVKLVGSAQRRTPWAFLQHGSIRLRDDSALYRALLDECPPLLSEVPQRTLHNVAAGLTDAFRRALGGRLEGGDLSDSERSLALERQTLRMRDPLVAPRLSSRMSASFADMLP